MVIDPKRREMFADLYRLAEYYESPPFQPGDIDGNAEWFVEANNKMLIPFAQKYAGDQLAIDLALAILEAANKLGVAANSLRPIL